jgi:2-furoyl-CoA dehydrogenase large subunit
MNMPKVKFGSIETPSPHTYSGAKGMGEGGAAPVHTMSAALQDALISEGIVIDDSFNNAETIFRSLALKERAQRSKIVKVEKRV